jgi:excisionase family DNA binding protein
METTRKYYSINEVAVMLGVNAMSIYRWTNDGRIPSVKLGTRRVIPIAELDALLQSGGVK